MYKSRHYDLLPVVTSIYGLACTATLVWLGRGGLRPPRHLESQYPPPYLRNNTKGKVHYGS